jgi:hypothetical protein
MNAETELAYRARLLAAFGGDPTGWEYNGEVREQDPATGGVHCACGHQGLRWLFPWVHPAHPRAEVITGSVCVDTVPGLSPTSVLLMKTRLEEVLSKRREDERLAREAARAARVQVLRAEVEHLFAQRYGSLRARRMKGEWLAVGELMDFYQSQRLASALKAAGKLKSPHGQLARLEAIRHDLAR